MPALSLPSRRPRMIATDLDGTIIGYRHTRSGRLSPRTIAALRDAHDAGVEVVFVTGRPLRWLGPLSAQLGPVGPVADIDDDAWRTVVDVNLTGVFLSMKHEIAHMRAHGGGTIVNIGSISAQIVNRPQWQPGYNASKAAVHQLTKSLAAEWAPYGVRVNALAPGYVKTDMARVDEPQFRRNWIEDAPMRRYAVPAELGPSLVFLASDASSFMTGSVLVVDGGYTLF